MFKNNTWHVTNVKINIVDPSVIPFRTPLSSNFAILDGNKMDLLSGKTSNPLQDIANR